MAYFYLAIAVLAEVVATSLLKTTEGFTRWLPSLFVVLGYGCAFYFLTLTLDSIPVGVSYAIWSGVGIVLITIAAMFLYNQKPDLPAVIGLALIVSGVVVLNLFSKMSAH